ncbi:unnamed protein product [Prorocentrum cordatum]|uniref:J domain-containing protein n=1 Tax=Prorocentrum cordatum TaxID=2364126 RepID=A0ABN9ST71_9DINO|nr:unnamed protein product [Polarella glacialis]
MIWVQARPPRWGSYAEGGEDDLGDFARQRERQAEFERQQAREEFDRIMAENQRRWAEERRAREQEERARAEARRRDQESRQRERERQEEESSQRFRREREEYERWRQRNAAPPPRPPPSYAYFRPGVSDALRSLGLPPGPVPPVADIKNRDRQAEATAEFQRVKQAFDLLVSREHGVRKEARTTACKCQCHVQSATLHVPYAHELAALQSEPLIVLGRLTRFLDWLGSLPFQGALALAAGTAGMLAVVGPSSFARLFLALWGSTVAALLAGAAFALLVDRTAGGGNLGSFTDAVVTLVQGGEGRGSDLVGCLVWLVLTVLGIVRWATSFECALYALLDEVKMDADGTLLIDDRDNLRLPLVDSAHKEVANGRSARR